jgi:glycosyltransferase involved in cell wall biosynthesis
MQLPKAHRNFRAVSLDFANELHVLAQCIERLFISRVETGLLSGLGFPSHDYPYLPIGAIRKRLVALRHRRSETPQTSGLMLIVGTAAHNTTGTSMRWFVEQALAHGLPSGVQVVLAGAYTDKLLPAGSKLPGLDARGWVEQAELDDLLVRAQAVLMPQLSGFGALTRVPEMACAGLPIILSRHATYGLTVPQGVVVVDNVWSDWRDAMLQVCSQPSTVTLAEYEQWEKTQSRPLSPLLTQLSTQLAN